MLEGHRDAEGRPGTLAVLQAPAAPPGAARARGEPGGARLRRRAPRRVPRQRPRVSDHDDMDKSSFTRLFEGTLGI